MPLIRILRKVPWVIDWVPTGMLCLTFKSRCSDHTRQHLSITNMERRKGCPLQRKGARSPLSLPPVPSPPSPWRHLSLWTLLQNNESQLTSGSLEGALHASLPSSQIAMDNHSLNYHPDHQWNRKERVLPFPKDFNLYSLPTTKAIMNSLLKCDWQSKPSTNLPNSFKQPINGEEKRSLARRSFHADKTVKLS